MNKNKKTDYDKLAEGAAKIKKAQEEATKIEPLEIDTPSGTWEEIIKRRATILPGYMGIKLAGDTTPGESMMMLDWAMVVHSHSGFLIGDIINFGETKWGEKYNVALNKTGRALPTLKEYSKVCRRIPFEARGDKLSDTGHRKLALIEDSKKIATAIKEVEKLVDKKSSTEVSALIDDKVRKLRPKKKATSGKGKKRKAKPEPPPYEPTDEEWARMDAAEEIFNSARDAVTADDGALFKVVGQCDNKEKHRWLTILEPLSTFRDKLERVTGYV